MGGHLGLFEAQDLELPVEIELKEVLDNVMFLFLLGCSNGGRLSIKLLRVLERAGKWALS